MKRGRVIIVASILLMAAAAFIPVSPGIGTARAGDEITPPKPLPSCMVNPVYPEREKIDGITGTVLLGVEVGSDGKIASLTAEQQVAGHPAFTSSAMAAIAKWCFEPARQDGRAVACSIKIPVRFALGEKKSS